MKHNKTRARIRKPEPEQIASSAGREQTLHPAEHRCGREDYGRAETSTVTLNFVSNSDGSQDCK